MTIRRTPEDFDVHERLSADWTGGVVDAWSPERPFAAFEISKVSLTTPDAVGLLAKRVGIPVGKWSYAGLKDKHARTSQVVTVPVADAGGAAKLPREATDSRWGARLLGYSAGEIAAEHIDRNVFTLIVRDLSKQAAAEMDRRAGVLRDQQDGRAGPGGDRLLVVNYFGSQRFGSARHKRGFAAAYLAKGDFEEALGLLIASPSRKDSPRVKTFGRMLSERWGDWKELATELPRCPERRAIETLAAGGGFREAFAALPYFTQQMCVEAFQSHVWNETVRGMVEALEGTGEHAAGSASGADAEPGTGGSSRSGRGKSLLHADDLFGKLVFAGPDVLPVAWRDLVVPMPAKGVELAEPWRAHAATALEAEGLTMQDLRIPDLRRPFFGKADRPLAVWAERFEMSEPERDEASRGKRLKRTLRFELPRGAYATVVLRALGQ